MFITHNSKLCAVACKMINRNFISEQYFFVKTFNLPNMSKISFLRGSMSNYVQY